MSVCVCLCELKNLGFVGEKIVVVVVGCSLSHRRGCRLSPILIEILNSNNNNDNDIQREISTNKKTNEIQPAAAAAAAINTQNEERHSHISV